MYIYPLSTAFGLARDAGCDGVELVVAPELLLRGPGPVARLAARTGLAIGAIHPPLFNLPGWRRDGPVLPRLADLARALDIPTIVVHPPRVTQLDDPLVSDFLAQLAEARRRLQGTAIQVTLENPGFFRPPDYQRVLWHLPALRRFAEEHELQLALDTTHVGASPYSLPESYAIARDRLVHVHLSDLCAPPHWLDRPDLDTYVKHHQLPGTGCLPLAEFLHTLGRDGFRGDITLEISPVSLEIWRPARTRRHLAEAVATTRRLLAGHPL